MSAYDRPGFCPADAPGPQKEKGVIAMITPLSFHCFPARLGLVRK